MAKLGIVSGRDEGKEELDVKKAREEKFEKRREMVGRGGERIVG